MPFSVASGQPEGQDVLVDSAGDVVRSATVRLIRLALSLFGYSFVVAVVWASLKAVLADRWWVWLLAILLSVLVVEVVRWVRRNASRRRRRRLRDHFDSPLVDQTDQPGPTSHVRLIH